MDDLPAPRPLSRSLPCLLRRRSETQRARLVLLPWKEVGSRREGDLGFRVLPAPRAHAVQAVGLSREGKRTAEERPVLRHLRTAVRRPLGEPPRSAWVVSSTLRFGYKLSCSTERLCQPHAWGYPSPSLHPREFRLSGSGGMWPGERAGSAWPLASCVNPLLKSRHLQGPQRSHPPKALDRAAGLSAWLGTRVQNPGSPSPPATC